MGGQVWLESEPDAGSTFIFTVWLGIGSPQGRGRVLPEKLQGLRVLVADDNPAAREVLAEIYKAENKVLPQVLEFGPQRRDKCRHRLAKNPGKFLDRFTRAVIKAQETPFLRGEGDRGWKADIDWFVANDHNVIRVMEGRYDAGARASP